MGGGWTFEDAETARYRYVSTRLRQWSREFYGALADSLWSETRRRELSVVAARWLDPEASVVVREGIVGPDLVSQRGANTRLVREPGLVYGDRVVRKWVYMDFGGRPTSNGRAIWKTLLVLFVCAIERSLTHEGNFLDASEEDLGGRIHGESRVMMVVVVPTEEGREVVLSGIGPLESTGVVGLVFESPELRFAEGVVVGHVGTVEAARDPE